MLNATKSDFPIAVSTRHLLNFVAYDQNFTLPPLVTVELSSRQEWSMWPSYRESET